MSEDDKSATKSSQPAFTEYRRPREDQLKEIEASLLADGENKDLWSWYATTLYGLDRHDEAVLAYQRVLDLDPGNVRALYDLANAQAKVGDLDEARRLWKQIVAEHPKSREAKRARGKLGEETAGETPAATAPATGPGDAAAGQPQGRPPQMDSLMTMARGICHEMNNPLTTVIGFADLLAVPEVSAQERQRLVEGIVEAGQRCAQVLDRFADFARRVAIDEPADADLSTLIDELVSIVDGSFRAQGVQIVTRLESKLELTAVDAPRIQHAILALLTNAQEAMPHGGMLEITTQRDGDTATLTIRDTGEGLETEEIQHIFDPFYTKKRNWTGVGLGLSEVRTTIEGHGGTITCESVKGEGATFRISLPCVAAARDMVATQVAKGACGPVSPRTLVVSKDPVLKGMMVEFLEIMGAEVTTELDLDRSVGKISRGESHSLILDPEFGGARLIQEIEGVRTLNSKIRVLLLLGKTWRRDSDPLLDDPYIRIVRKPFRLSALKDQLEHLGVSLPGPLIQ